MKVNAHVTAVTSILESIGLLIIFITWGVITKSSGYATLIQATLLYFIVLPYVFLMNTSENKARIIEDGWFNVIKNVVTIGYSSPRPSEVKTNQNVKQKRPKNKTHCRKTVPKPKSQNRKDHQSQNI